MEIPYISKGCGSYRVNKMIYLSVVQIELHFIVPITMIFLTDQS